MTGPKIQRVKPGDNGPIRAQDWNAIADATERTLKIPSGSTAPQVTAPFGAAPQMVLVRNDSADDAPRGSWLALRESMIDPETSEIGFMARPAFRGKRFVEGSESVDPDRVAGGVAFTYDQIPAGRTGRAVVGGVVNATIQVFSDLHTHAMPATLNPEGGLVSSFSGFAQILWKEPGVGERKAILNIRQMPRDRFPAIITGYAPMPGRDIGWLYGWQEVNITTVSDEASGVESFGKLFGANLDSSGRGISSSPANINDITEASERTALVSDNANFRTGVTNMLATNIKEAHFPDIVLGSVTQLAINAAACASFEGLTNPAAEDSPGVPTCAGGDNYLGPRVLPFPIGLAVMMETIRVDRIAYPTGSGTGSSGTLPDPTNLNGYRFIFDAMNPIAFAVPATSGA